MSILVFAILLLLLYLAWQDFTYRAVYWYVFPVLGALLLVNALMLGTCAAQSIAANFAVLAVQFGLLHGYFWVKHRRWLMQGQQYLGWGDVCFMAVLTVCLSPLNFVAFMLLSLSAVLVTFLLLRLCGLKNREVPLAGGQAVLLVLLLGMDYRHHGVSLYSDHYVEQFLLRIV